MRHSHAVLSYLWLQLCGNAHTEAHATVVSEHIGIQNSMQHCWNITVHRAVNAFTWSYACCLQPANPISCCTLLLTDCTAQCRLVPVSLVCSLMQSIFGRLHSTCCAIPVCLVFSLMQRIFGRLHSSMQLLHSDVLAGDLMPLL